MDYVNPNALVSSSWLEQHIKSPRVKIVDATYYLPNDKRNAAENYAQCHIPGAVFFNIDEICDDTIKLPHMLPRPENFSFQVSKMGLGNDDRIIIYDSSGGFMAACRVWWMFRMFGHENVAVLNGGLPKWIHEKRSTTEVETIPEKQLFSIKTNPKIVKNISQIIENIDKNEFQVIDARSSGRYCGNEPEPRPTKKVGHIPGSFNIPFTVVLNPKKHFTFKSAGQIQAVFEEVGVDINKSITTSCGSGVTAAVLTLALYLIGSNEVAIYDGSWAEWGDHPDTKVAP